MKYDCSITKRKGCNYCLRRKTVMGSEIGFAIDDEKKIIEIFYDDANGHTGSEHFEINYCPICGKYLNIQ